MAKNPFILLTTSRRPTKNMRTFCRDISHTFPNVMRVNRGKLSVQGIAEKAVELDAEKAMIVERWKGGMGRIRFFKISEKGLDAVSPSVCIGSVKLRRDLRQNTSRTKRMKPLIIASSRKAPLKVRRLENALSEFFNIPILPIDEVIKGKYDAAMQISVDRSNNLIITFKLAPELVEFGPQITVFHLVWS